MILSNYHSHSTFSDGKTELEKNVQAAIEMGCPELGFSDHAPMILRSSWGMLKAKSEEYKRAAYALKEKYKGQIELFVGIEQDYFSTPANGYEYILGSVHYIYKDGKYLPLDFSAKKTKENIDKHYGGDALAYCEDYYKLVGDIYNKTKCNIIGHFDLITKFNEVEHLIDTSHPRYKNAAMAAVKELLKSPAIFEINTGAISRGYRTDSYPESFILDMIAESKRPFVINSDSHSDTTITFGFESEAKRLDKKGYKYITSLNEIL